MASVSWGAMEKSLGVVEAGLYRPMEVGPSASAPPGVAQARVRIRVGIGERPEVRDDRWEPQVGERKGPRALDGPASSAGRRREAGPVG